MTVSHPTDALMSDFLLGKLPDAEHDAVEEHLGRCAACEARAATVAPVDTFAELLTSALERRSRQLAAVTTPSPCDAPSVSAPTGAFPHLSRETPVPPGLVEHPRYRLVRPLGAGGMGSVWLAHHLVLDRTVAIKVIRPELLTSPGAVERFRREARAVAKLSHAHIVGAFDAEEAVGTHFLVMEYVAGESLADVVARGPLPCDEACRAARDAALGLAHAHAAGLAHRDVKPSNLIRTPEGVTKVLDFGLATAEVGSAAGLTSQNMVIGTPDYIAPEQAEQASAADARSDVYSLGCTLYHLLAGRVPFQGGSPLKKLDAHRFAEIPTLPHVPPELAALVARMMAKKPAVRPSAGEVAAALEPFCAGSVPRARSRRRLWPVVVAVLLALAGLAGGAVIYKIQRDREEITIETTDPDIEVVMRRNGELIRIVDTKNQRDWELDTRRMRLKPDGSELSIDLPGKEPLTLRRNGNVAVILRRTPAVPTQADAGERAGLEIQVRHRIPFHFKHWHDFSMDGALFLALTQEESGPVAVFFASDTGKEVQRLPLPAAQVLCVWFLPGGDDLLVCADYQLSRWNRRTRKKVADLIRLQPGPAYVRLPSRDGARLAVWCENVEGVNRHQVLVYDLTAKKLAFRVRSLTPTSVLCMFPVFSPDGKLLATVDSIPKASVVRLWDAAGTLVKSLELKGTAVGTLEFGRGGAEIKVVYGTDGNGPGLGPYFVGAWDVLTLQQRCAVPMNFDGVTYASLLSDNNLEIAYLSAKRVVRIWDTRTGKRAAEYPVPAGLQSSLTSRDGRQLLLVTDGRLELLRLPFVGPDAKYP